MLYQNNNLPVLSDFCESITDCEHKTAPIQQQGIPSIRTPNIGKGSLILDGANRVSEEIYKLWTARIKPQEGDLIMAREAPVGNVAIIPKGLKVCLGQRTVLLRPNKNKIVNHYLLYLLLSDEVQNHIKSLSNGATVHHLNVKEIRNLALPRTPSITTQQKIASILSAYDDLIENNNKRIKILEQTANSIYKDWFIDFNFSENEKTKFIESKLGKIPEGWLVGKIKNIAEIKSGFSFRSPDFKNKGKYGLVTIKNVQDGIFQQNCQSFFDILPKNLPNHCLLSEGDILLSLTGNVGRVCIVIGNDYLLNQRVALLKPIKPEQREFVYFLFRQTSMLKKLESISKGVAQQNLSPIETSELETIIPPSDLLTLFSKTAKPLLDSVINLNKKNKVLYLTRNTLLPKLISGELDVEGLDIKIRPEIL